MGQVCVADKYKEKAEELEYFAKGSINRYAYGGSIGRIMKETLKSEENCLRKALLYGYF